MFLVGAATRLKDDFSTTLMPAADKAILTSISMSRPQTGVQTFWDAGKRVPRLVWLRKIAPFSIDFTYETDLTTAETYFALAIDYYKRIGGCKYFGELPDFSSNKKPIAITNVSYEARAFESVKYSVRYEYFHDFEQSVPSMEPLEYSQFVETQTPIRLELYPTTIDCESLRVDINCQMELMATKDGYAGVKFTRANLVESTTFFNTAPTLRWSSSILTDAVTYTKGFAHSADGKSEQRQTAQCIITPDGTSNILSLGDLLP